MTTEIRYRAIALLTTLSLAISSFSGTSAHSFTTTISFGMEGLTTPVATPEATEATVETEEDSSGWLNTVVDRGGDIIGDVTDATVDGAGAAWEAVEQVPGAIWNVFEDAPGAIWDFITQAPETVARLWQPVWDVLTARYEIPGIAEFLADHPLIRTLLTPIMFLFGIAYDGTISFIDAGLISLALLVPIIKTGPILITGIQKALPWASETRTVVTTVRRNPSGIIAGISDSVRLMRARAIAPSISSISNLPRTPGVYVAMDGAGKPLYVGMSNSLNRRLMQHFSNTPSPFVATTEKIKFIPTESVTYARTLECALIKQLDPTFNIVHRGPGGCPIYMPPSPSVFVIP